MEARGRSGGKTAMWSFLYIVLIGLAVVELGLVAWTANFLRRYAFRPNAVAAQAHDWPRHAAGMSLAGSGRRDEAKRR